MRNLFNPLYPTLDYIEAGAASVATATMLIAALDDVHIIHPGNWVATFEFVMLVAGVTYIVAGLFDIVRYARKQPRVKVVHPVKTVLDRLITGLVVVLLLALFHVFTVPTVAIHGLDILLFGIIAICDWFTGHYKACFLHSEPDTWGLEQTGVNAFTAYKKQD